MKTRKEKVLQALQEIGLKPRVDEDGDILVRYQMKYIYVGASEEDSLYCRLLMPNIHQISEGEESIVLATCNKVTRQTKCLKTFVAKNFECVHASFEFYASEEALADTLKIAFDTIGKAQGMFNKYLDDFMSLKEE